jgi:hypothetical protein
MKKNIVSQQIELSSKNNGLDENIIYFVFPSQNSHPLV